MHRGGPSTLTEIRPPHVTIHRHKRNMAEGEATKALSGLLNGIAQKEFYDNSDVTEELLRAELFPEMPQEEFRTLHGKMRSLLKVPHHRQDGTSSAAPQLCV